MKLLLLVSSNILMLLIIAGICFSQQPIFTVIAASKNVTKITNEGTRTKISIGDKISEPEKILLGTKAYLCIADNNGKSIEITKEGTYDLNDLIKKLQNKSSNTLQKYIEFIKDQMQKEQARNDDYGAVLRQRRFPTGGYLELDFPIYTSLFDTTITFSWYNFDGKNTYLFRMLSPSGNTVMLRKTVDTSVTLDLNKMNLTKDTLYYWSVSLLNSDVFSDTVCFRIISDTKLYEMEKELNDIIKNDDPEEKAINQILIGKIYNKYNMKVEALGHYYKSVEYSNGADDYKTVLRNYLGDNLLFRRMSMISN